MQTIETNTGDTDMIRYVTKGGKHFKLTFDAYGVLDEVFQIYAVKPERQLNGSNRDVQSFVANQDDIRNCQHVKGMKITRAPQLFPVA